MIEDVLEHEETEADRSNPVNLVMLAFATVAVVAVVIATGLSLGLWPALAVGVVLMVGSCALAMI